jgi:hypothetical protein
LETPELKLIAAPDPRTRVGSRTSLALCLILLAAGGLATLLGADQARVKVEAGEVADDALRLALERGIDDAEVQAALVHVRRTLGRRPLDARSRVVYASLLLGLSSSEDDIRLAAFHAGRAAELAPVTLSVVRPAALVLAHTRNLERSLELVRSMFGYEPGRAAAVLAEIEARVLGVTPEDGIPPTADAWMAWVRQLRLDHRTADEDAWLRRTHERWPENLAALEQLAARSFYAGDWTTFNTLFPPDLTLPDERRAATALAWRARSRVRRKDVEGARSDAELALRLEGASSGVRMVVGDVFADLQDHSRARLEWNRALHQLEPAGTADRRSLLSRLARLEDEFGRPAAALRHWQALLELDPGHVKARRRIDDLTGFQR